ncbi:MAG: DUF2156 domain-containing protein [Acutalibacteraceae bacterium]
MLKFKVINYEDIEILKAYFSAYPSRQCDRAFGSTFMWRKYFDNRYAVVDGTMIISSKYNGQICFANPMGRNPDAAYKAIEEYCGSLGVPMVLCSINKSELPLILEKYPGSVAEADRDWFDYLYEKDAILNLSGRKYSTPRNHINKFKKLYNWSFAPITEADIPELIEFTEGFTFHAEKDESADFELKICREVLQNYKAFGLPGGILRVDGKIIGYSVGEILGDTLFCHIEKADFSYAGAYQMLTNQFLRLYASGDDIKYVNREEDCGDEGLRKSKLSYNPVELIEKNTVTIKIK